MPTNKKRLVSMSEDSEPSAAISAWPSQCSEPQPLSSDRRSVFAVPISDRELLKEIFESFVRETHKSTKSWVSYRNIKMI